VGHASIGPLDPRNVMSPYDPLQRWAWSRRQKKQLPARRGEAGDDPIANLEPGDGPTDRLDHSGALVASTIRSGPAGVATESRQVAVAHPAGADPDHERRARLGRERYVLDTQWLVDCGEPAARMKASQAVVTRDLSRVEGMAHTADRSPTASGPPPSSTRRRGRKHHTPSPRSHLRRLLRRGDAETHHERHVGDPLRRLANTKRNPRATCAHRFTPMTLTPYNKPFDRLTQSGQAGVGSHRDGQQHVSIPGVDRRPLSNIKLSNVMSGMMAPRNTGATSDEQCGRWPPRRPGGNRSWR